MPVSAQDALAELARRELARREARADFGAFVGRYEPEYDATAAHTRIVREHLEALERGEIERLAIFMPPQHGKSFHTSENFPAWWIGRREDRKQRTNVAITAYGATKAYDYSRNVREKFLDPRNPFDTRVHPDASRVDMWSTVGGSQVIAGGVGGPLTGFGAHLLVIDDPIKDAVEALSQTDREKKWQWYLRVARTRLRKGARQLLCETRWHEDDLAGRILNSAAAKRWTVLTLPARCIDPASDPLGRKVGEVLWPDGPDIPTPGDGETSTRVYEAMYQQRPAPADGSIFKREWFEHRSDPPSSLISLIQVIDSAWQTGVSNDYSVIATWGFDGLRYHVIDVWKERVEFPDLRRASLDAFDYYRPNALLVEDKASGTAIIQEFKAGTNLPVIPIVPHGSKISRAEAASPIFEAGLVVLPKSGPWIDAFIEEHIAFPNGKHDDQVDTTSMALKYLSERVTRPRPFAIRGR